MGYLGAVQHALKALRSILECSYGPNAKLVLFEQPSKGRLHYILCNKGNEILRNVQCNERSIVGTIKSLIGKREEGVVRMVFLLEGIV